jgi:monoamine oxidase
MKRASIAIIGAGLAGLTAAYRLKQLGHSPIVYEARPRPGGRIYTIPVGDSYEELGGKSLQDGGDGKYILSLINELGLKTEVYSVKWGHKYIYQNNSYHPFDILKNFIPSKTNIDSLCKHFIQTTKSVGEIFDILFSCNPAARSFMAMWARNFDGSDAYHLAPEYIHFYLPLAYRFSCNYEKAVDEFDFISVQGGNSRLIGALVKQVVSIQYDHPLRSIKEINQTGYLLDFGNDRAVLANYVLFAIPCSTLRDIQIGTGIFASDQIQAIHTLQYGTNRKVLLPVTLSKAITEAIWTENTSIWFNKQNDVMTFYMGGSQGSLNAQQVNSLIKHELDVVKAFYPELNWPDEMPNLTTSDWEADQFSRGSYSNFGVGQAALFHPTIETQGEQMREVFRPAKNRILFAGEHTDIENPATMEGAALSGEKGARIMHRLIVS